MELNRICSASTATIQYYILLYFYFPFHLKRLCKMCSMLLLKYGWVCVRITADGCNIGIENVYTQLIAIFFAGCEPQCMLHPIYIRTYTLIVRIAFCTLVNHPIILLNSFYFHCRQKMWISALFGLFLSDLLDIAAASSNYDGKNQVRIHIGWDKTQCLQQVGALIPRATHSFYIRTDITNLT